MAVTILIPAPLRRFTEDRAAVQVDAKTVGEALAKLDELYPGLRERICEPDGRVRRFVSVFVNGKDIRSLQGIDTPLNDGDEVGIIPAMAGGR
ncbi:MoaD family protein [Thermomicrobium sp. 4228-Ro]|uniref:ubiquitin-like small modifier protein 1 n=1 Tax=Thermomicrobium sp. 4228-Ro TaxID=2993937 RepID=UPI0022491DC3|nr:ubiquitin-like small modifier protein 1 [Thermomicrobium sp. 4228-Ro]MCX2727415.1 MoaD family protein [Thermomicrobium sp. 4228-Ro]